MYTCCIWYLVRKKKQKQQLFVLHHWWCILGTFFASGSNTFASEAGSCSFEAGAYLSHTHTHTILFSPYLNVAMTNLCHFPFSEWPGLRMHRKQRFVSWRGFIYIYLFIFMNIERFTVTESDVGSGNQTQTFLRGELSLAPHHLLLIETVCRLKSRATVRHGTRLCWIKKKQKMLFMPF